MKEKLVNIYKQYQEIINYLIIGTLTVFVNLFCYYICTFTFLDVNIPLQLQIANIISWIFAVLFAFYFNRNYVFKSKNRKILKESLKFFLSRVITLIIDMIYMYITVSILKYNNTLMKFISNIIVIIMNYILSKIFVFIKR